MALTNTELMIIIVIAIYYCVISFVSFLIYGFDKRAAKNNNQRISEKSLHFFALIGGWPGAWVGQKMFRHKTRKTKFLVVYFLTVVINVAALGGILALFFYHN